MEYRDHGRLVAVRTPTSEFTLPRKPGNLGQRFSSEEATLIIDGDFAALAESNPGEYSQCRAVSPGPEPTSLSLKRKR